MTPARARAALLILALGLGGTAGWAARRLRGPVASPVHPAGWFSPEEAPRAWGLLRRLVAGLAQVQEADGGFALWSPRDRPSQPEPEVKRAAATALAAWALGEAVACASGGPGSLEALARERALGYLLGQQQADGRGGFGRMPPNPLGAQDRGPEVTALAAGTLALALAAERTQETRFAVPATLGTRALGAALQGSLREGWMRAIAAMAIDGLLATGRQGDLGPRPRQLLATGKAPTDPDCGDFRVAEAIVRTLRGEQAGADPYPQAVLSACVSREPPAWNGQASDLSSWLMQGWLAARRPEGGAWFAAVLPALEEALGRDDLVAQSIYADRVTQSACGLLVLAQGLARGGAR